MFDAKQINASVFAAALLVDQATKYWARSVLPYASAQDSPFFVFALHRNYGISFSLFGGYPHLSFFIALSGLSLLFCVFRYFKDLQSPSGWALLLAGAVGNFIDRVIWGYVIDWVYVGIHSNIADVLLCIGGLLLVVSAGRSRPWGGGYHRSTVGQIEYWATLGRTAEDNPELLIDFVKEILISKGQSRLLAEPFKPE